MERSSWSRLDLTDEGDAKYVSELSTVLVATIQETKDRISLMEHIFCSQLFPNINSNWKRMQNAYSEAQNAAEDSWKKESGLLVQIEELKTENHKLAEENKELKKAETEKIQEGCIMQLHDCKKSLQWKIIELERDMKEKFIKLRDAEQSLDSLFKWVHRDGKHLVEYESQLNEQKRKASELVVDLESSKKEICKLQEELRKKCRDVDEAKEVREDLLKKIECQALKITNYEGILKGCENEIKLQSISLKQLKESVNELQGGLEIKSKEVDEGKKVQQLLAQQIKQKSSPILVVEQHLKDQQCENSKLSLKVTELEERVGQLQFVLQDKMIDQERKDESIKQLSHTVELKKCELVSEKNKTREAYVEYKKLKSMYNFLLQKTGLTPESISAENKKQAEVNSVIDAHNLEPLTDLKRRDPTVQSNPSHDIKLKDDSGWNKHQNNEEWVRSGQSSDFCTSDFVTIGTSKKTNRGRASPLVGTKRPASRWRDTRSHQNQDGPDPHDDFLNTPFENIRGNLNKVMVEEVHELPDPVPLEVNLSSSDDEVKKSARLCSEKQEKQPTVRCSKGYKYVEPVRKKAERDNLKGVECKQCKKFYDAVLPTGGGNEKHLRCEHHDGVSRHRYKHTPPMTPEGFWNIGFDTEKTLISLGRRCRLCRLCLATSVTISCLSCWLCPILISQCKLSQPEEAEEARLVKETVVDRMVEYQAAATRLANSHLVRHICDSCQYADNELGVTGQSCGRHILSYLV